jgi:PKD repeat protein
MALVEGIAYWASVTTPNTTYTPVYTVNLVVDNEVANDFRSRGFTVKDMEEGPALLIKRKVNGPNGMIRSAPKLLDRNKQPLNVAVGNGSKVRVQYKEWETTWNGTSYKGLDFQAMQVLDLIEYANPDGAEFDIVSDDNDGDEL